MAPRLHPLLTPPNDGTQKENRLDLRVALKKGAGHPCAKLILGLRHPTFRAYSHWRMEVGRGDDTLPFEVAISDAGRRRVRQATGGVHRIYSYVERGFYAKQIRRLFDLFPRENVHIFRTDRLWIDPAITLAEIERFLGVGAEVSVRAERRYVVPTRSAGTGHMPDRARATLDEMFRADIVETGALTGLDLSDWLSSDYSEHMRPFSA